MSRYALSHLQQLEQESIHIIREVAAEQTDLTDEELDRLLDPLELTRGGIKS